MGPPFLSRAVRGARRIGRRATDPIPVTGLGVLAAAVFWAGLTYFAQAQMDMVLLVACSAGLGLTAISIVAVAVFAIVLRIRARHPGPTSELILETDRLTNTGWVLPSFAWLPIVTARWEWERPFGFTVEPERRRFRRHERVATAARGRYSGVRRRLIVEDVFRLARVAFRIDDPVVLEVRPHPGRLGRMEPLTAFAGGDEAPHPMGVADGDRTELRRYAPGDPARFIHWKVFARTRKLVVRVPERALSQARRTAAYLVAGPDDEASAAAALVAVERGALGREWVFCASGAAADATTVADATELVVSSASARSRGGSPGARGLAAFAERAEKSGPAAFVIFAPARTGEWVDDVIALASRRPRGLRVVIGVDGLAPAGDRGPLSKLFTVARRVRGLPVSVLDDTLRALAHPAIDVIVYDRVTGRRLGGAHVKKARRSQKREKPEKPKPKRAKAKPAKEAAA